MKKSLSNPTPQLAVAAILNLIFAVVGVWLTDWRWIVTGLAIGTALVVIGNAVRAHLRRKAQAALIKSALTAVAGLLPKPAEPAAGPGGLLSSQLDALDALLSRPAGTTRPGADGKD